MSVSPSPTSLSISLHCDPALWSKLQTDEPFSQLSSKYWGKRIEGEAEQWRKSHSTIVDDPENDIGPGCYVLDPGANSHFPKLWVRKDYIRIYDYCCAQHAQGPLTTGTQRSAVVTGQPGIGMSLSSVASCTILYSLTIVLHE